MISASRVPSGCVTVFGLPFLAAGLFALFTGLGWWAEYVRAASWARVPAEIARVKLESHRGSKGGRTWSVACAYHYRFDRANPGSPDPGAPRYEGDRVAVESGSSNGPEHRRRYDLLEHHRKTRQPFLAWVDPDDPQRSLLFREAGLLMYMLPAFGLIFTMVGGGIAAAGIWQAWRAKQKAALLRENPTRPWRAEPPFVTGFTILSSGKTLLATAWAAAVFFSLFTGPLCLALFSSPDVPWIGWLVIGSLGLSALGLDVAAIYQTIRFRKYGISRLELHEMPVVPGRQLAGHIVVGRPLHSEAGVKMRLAGVRTVGYGKQAKSTEFFAAEQTVREQQGFGRSGDTIAVRFDIPPELPSREPEGDTRIAYTLTVSAATPGVDFHAAFDVPVFQVGNPSCIESSQGGHSPSASARASY